MRTTILLPILAIAITGCGDDDTPPRPRHPYNLEATPGPEQVRLQWSAVKEADHYVLHWTDTPNPPFEGWSRFRLQENTFVHAGLTPYQTYRYRVTARNEGGTSDKSGEVLAVPYAFTDDPLDPTLDVDGWVHHGHPVDTKDEGLAIATDSLGRVLIAGETLGDMVVWRLLDDGQPDPTFGGPGYVTYPDTAGGGGSGRARGIAVDSANTLAVTGSSYAGNGLYQMVLWRIREDGLLDPTFGTGGYAISPGSTVGHDVIFDSQARIVVSGRGDANLWRYLPDGTPDPDFAGDGWLQFPGGGWGLALQIDATGNIVVGGTRFVPTAMAVWRYLDTGAPDLAFGGDGWMSFSHPDPTSQSYGHDLDIDAQGRILVAGKIGVGTGWEMGLWRLDDTGALDPAFNGTGYLSYRDPGSTISRHPVAWTVEAIPGGPIVAAGESMPFGRKMTVWWVRDDGTLDRTFLGSGVFVHEIPPDGPAIVQTLAFAATVDNAGRVVLTGFRSGPRTYADMMVWRLQ